MSKFGKYLGDLELEVGEEDISLDVKLKDVKKIIALQQQGQQEGEMYKELAEIYSKIMKRSYPDEDEEGLEAFLTKHFIDFMIEFNIEMGWADREDIEEKRKNLNARAKIED